jgi:hypothetical protein
MLKDILFLCSIFFKSSHMNFSMQKLRLLVLLCFIGSQAFCQALFMPQNIQKAYANKTRSMDGKPGENYWQNKAKYDIKIAVNPPSKTVNGSEEIVYINNSPGPVTRLVFKLIMNIHKPGVSCQGNASADYLTNGIVIDKYLENDKVQKFGNPGSTVHQIILAKPIAKGDSVKLNIDWHFDLSEESGREGKLDSTSFHLAYFYPRVAVLDDVHG